jgi:hypothetical protein
MTPSHSYSCTFSYTQSSAIINMLCLMAVLKDIVRSNHRRNGPTHSPAAVVKEYIVSRIKRTEEPGSFSSLRRFHV